MKNLFYLLAIFYLFNSGYVSAQKTISFEGTGLVSVEVANLNTGDTTVLVIGQELSLVDTANQEPTSISNQISPHKIKVYPNPMAYKSTISFLPPVNGYTTVSVYNITGELVAQFNGHLDNSNQQFMLSGLKNGVYFFKVNGNGYQLSETILSVGNYGTPKIELLASNHGKENNIKVLKSATAGVEMHYNEGDVLIYTGSSGNNKTVIADVPTESHTVEFSFTECKDAEDNYYTVVQIGTQLWMAEHLKSTKYSDGVSIPEVIDKDEWVVLADDAKAFSYFKNDPEHEWGQDGLFYTQAAATNGETSNAEPSGVQGICPEGWHLPSDAEFLTLEFYLASNGFNYDGSTFIENDTLYLENDTIAVDTLIVQYKIAKSLATIPATIRESDNEGAPGNTDFPGYINRSGFNWVFTGRRTNVKGTWVDKNKKGGHGGFLWTSSEGINRELKYSTSKIMRKQQANNNGYCVRCIKD